MISDGHQAFFLSPAQDHTSPTKLDIIELKKNDVVNDAIKEMRNIKEIIRTVHLYDSS